MNLFAGEKWRCRRREQIYGHSKRRRRWANREWHGNLHITYVKQIASGNSLYDAGSSNPVLCDNLEGWDGVGGRREVQEGGEICLPVAGSC